MIYYVEFEPNELSTEPHTRYIGVFSNSQKAKDACIADCEERIPDGKHLLWMGYGDSLRATCRDGLYAVMALELDMRIKTV